MPIFPSPEWMQAFCDALAAHPEVDEVASALDGTYRFVVEADQTLPETHRYDLAIRPDPVEVTPLPEPVDKPTLVLRANHDRWRQLIEGTLDIGMAVMLRRLKVQGDLSRLIGRVDRTKPLRDALGQVQTEWIDR